MPRRLVYLASAKRDLVEIFEHIARESGSVTVGTRFTEQIRRQCVKLAELPGMLGRARRNCTRTFEASHLEVT